VAVKAYPEAVANDGAVALHRLQRANVRDVTATPQRRATHAFMAAPNAAGRWRNAMNMIETVAPNRDLDRDARLLRDDDLDAVSGGGKTRAGEEVVYMTITLTNANFS
jgi:hypothetical protein